MTGKENLIFLLLLSDSNFIAHVKNVRYQIALSEQHNDTNFDCIVWIPLSSNTVSVADKLITIVTPFLTNDLKQKTIFNVSKKNTRFNPSKDICKYIILIQLFEIDISVCVMYFVSAL